MHTPLLVVRARPYSLRRPSVCDSATRTVTAVLGVDPPAEAPDLAVGPGERLNVAHLHHGRGEGAAECRRVGREVPDDAVGAAVVEELLVRVQETPLGQQVAEVGVVEGVGRRHVQRRQVAVGGGGLCRGAVGPE